MTGGSLMDFLITVVGLGLIVGLIFLALDYVAPDDRFKKIGRYAIGGVALIALLYAIKGVLFGGGGLMMITPVGLISFAIGVVVLLVVLYVIYLLLDKIAPVEFVLPVKYVIGAVALIVLLLLAQQTLFGGGAPIGNFRLR